MFYLKIHPFKLLTEVPPNDTRCVQLKYSSLESSASGVVGVQYVRT